MKEQSRIPTGKVSRAAKFVKTGAKVGGNYIKHYTQKLVDGEGDKAKLDQNNAKDIYNSLSELKGSALKVAQMLAMDKNMLPSAYQETFAMSQYSAPPLSYPLVVKTFRKYFDAGPDELFDEFEKSAANAASIGQVHRAKLDGKDLAVKIQYPGVADSVKSDLKLVKPFAVRLFNLNELELEQYLKEVESKLLEETDYDLEVRRSIEISEACSDIPGLRFPRYYKDLSEQRIITMEYLPGKHIKEFLDSNPDQETRNRIGQAMWDFYHHQIHNLKKVHADPHPGNFLIEEDGTLGIIDFGCVKEIPEDFYEAYFKLMSKNLVSDENELIPILRRLNFLHDDDSKQEQVFFLDIFKQMTELLGRPFHYDTFDFADDVYFEQIYKLSDRLSKDKRIRSSSHPRGPKDGLYINRTYFGLYTLLNQLKAKVNTTKPEWLSRVRAKVA